MFFNKKITSLVDVIDNTEKLYEGDLREYVRKLFEFHNVDLPFHGLRHMLDVTWKSYHGGKYHKLSPRRLRNLLIAAIYHDANHPGQINGMDANSVQRAIETFRRQVLEIDKEFEEEIIQIILATEYPHRNEASPKPPSLEQRIIRDADVTMMFSDVWLQQIIVGISREKKQSIRSTWFEQIKHISSIHFYSEWGQKTFQPMVQPKVEEVQRWLKILGYWDDYKMYIGAG